MNRVIAFEQSILPAAISTNAKGALAALLYADVFSYPLTADEIFERCTLLHKQDVINGLKQLVDNKIVYLFNGFYSLENDASRITKRLAANQLAKQSLKKAERMTKVIRCFPFVRAVMLSGSISKNYMDKHSDIDYFIITAPNRLWVSRLFFVLYQKIVFLNKYKYFCYNYMVDEDHLSMGEKSLFTAMETVTLLPTYNYGLYTSMLHANAWSQAYLPNYPAATQTIFSIKSSKLQSLLEKCFNNRFGEWLDKWLLQKIQDKWKRNHPPSSFGNRGLTAKRHVAKAHTEGHYNTIMEKYEQKKLAYEQRYQISFDDKPHLIEPVKLNA
jgi:hypothetical protein